MVGRVNHVDVALRVKGDADGQGEGAGVVAVFAESGQEVALPVEDEHPIALRVGDVDAAPLRGQIGLVDHRLAVPAMDRPFGQEVEIPIELLHPLIPGVGYVDVAFLVYGDAHRLVHLAVQRPCPAPLAQEPALGVELLNPLVACVRHVDVALGVYGHVPRSPEDAGGPQGALRDAVGAPLEQEAALGVEFLDAVIPGVGHVDGAVVGHGDAPRLLKLAGAIPLAAPLGKEMAVGIEFLDAVVAAVHYVDVALFIHGYVAGVLELALACPLAPPGEDGRCLDAPLGIGLLHLGRRRRADGKVPELVEHVLAHTEIEFVHVIPIVQGAWISAIKGDSPQFGSLGWVTQFAD